MSVVLRFASSRKARMFSPRHHAWVVGTQVDHALEPEFEDEKSPQIPAEVRVTRHVMLNHADWTRSGLTRCRFLRAVSVSTSSNTSGFWRIQSPIGVANPSFVRRVRTLSIKQPSSA